MSWVLLLTTSAALAAPTPDAETAPTGAPIHLVDLIAEAEELNEATGIAQQRVRQAAAGVRRAVAGLLPNAELTGVYANRDPTAQANPDAVFRAENAWNAQLEVGMRIFDASQIPEIGEAQSERAATELDGDELVRTLRFEVAIAFYAVLVAEGALQAAQERLVLALQTLEDISGRFEAGLASRNDQRRTELELASARLALTRARNAVRQTRLQLGYLVGRPVTEPLVAEAEYVDVSELTMNDVLEMRPDVLAVEARIEAAERAELEAWLRLVPTIDAGLQVNASNETGFQDSPFSRNVLLTATWPLYDGGIRYADARDSEARARELSLERDQLVRRVDRDIEQARAQLDAATEAVQEAEQQVEVAELNYDEVRERFDHGLATALEQADAAVQRFTAQVQLAEAQFAERQATLRLLQALGLNSPVPRPDADADADAG